MLVVAVAVFMFLQPLSNICALELGTINPNPPVSPIRLIFIHHSTGENWLADENGGLGIGLGNNNYFVSDTNYGWGPESIGDRTDIGQWWLWFRGPHSSIYLNALYAESAQHSSYTRLPGNLAGENEIIMFKSCFPNSALKGSPSDPVPPIDKNPLRGQDSGSDYHTVANAEGIYIDLLNYFRTRRDKLFIVITAPPLSDPTYSSNARAFNQWLVNDWLNGYPYPNVFVFDFYNVLTSNGGNPDENDLGWVTGNHHRLWQGAIQHKTDGGRNTNAYPTGDDHPSRAGNLKATAEFLPLLNIAYNRWQSQVTTIVTLSPSMGPTGTAVTVSGSGWNKTDTSVTFANASLFDGTQTCTVSGGSIVSGCSFTVKANALGGTYNLTFTGTLGDSTQAQFLVAPMITLSTTSGPFGTDASITGSGFAAGDTACTVSSSPTGLVSNPSCAVSAGIVAASFTVASGASGPYTVTVSGNTGDAASKSFTLTAVQMTVSYSIVGGGTPTAPVFYYVLNGAAKSLKLSKTAQSIQVDGGTSWSVVPNPLGGSGSSQGWYSNQQLNGTASPTTLVFTFYRQTVQTLSCSVSGGGSGYSLPTFQANQFGSLASVTLTTTVTKYWFDYGSAWTVGPNPLTGSNTGERWFTTQATAGTIGSAATHAFKFQLQYYLQVAASRPGTVAPSSGWLNAGQSMTIGATAKTGHRFQSWTGTGTGSYTGTKNPATITMNSAITETANFS